jgi:hypothetical protein
MKEARNTSSKNKGPLVAVVAAAAFAVVVLFFINFGMPSGLALANHTEVSAATT